MASDIGYPGVAVKGLHAPSVVSGPYPDYAASPEISAWFY